MHKFLTGLAVALMFSGCAATGSSVYGPANGDKFGYAETKIETGRFRVTYRGAGGVPSDVVEGQALRRAAELTLDNGYDWFRVVDRAVEGEKRGGVSLGAGVGGGSSSRRSGVGVGVSGDFGKIGAKDFYTARLEILMGNNPQPSEASVYDARSVRDAAQ